MSRIIDVIAKKNYILEIHLDNNHTIVCDMSNRLKGIRFSGLKDVKRFNSFQICNGTTVRWSDNCELSIDELLTMLED